MALLTTPITMSTLKLVLTQPLFQARAPRVRIVRWTEVTVLPVGDEDIIEERTLLA